MTNCKELRNRIDESGISIKFLADKCHVSREYFYRKLNGEVEFKQSEISTLKEVLRLSQSERDHIFFATEVD